MIDNAHSMMFLKHNYDNIRKVKNMNSMILIKFKQPTTDGDLEDEQL